MTKDFQFMPYMTLALGLVMLFSGIQEFKKSQVIGIMCYCVAVFSIFVGFYTM
ncbi:DUF3953 domain-containing protein [Viridibacillus sp. YIM B01967]|uniref:DUF3953 domain-containing protein n=1 Tax=Viridibacillus soli TaxID=2798301 RepID=A0ABS1H5R8_9BACL|nr:DUF3953 domain-containing protein [Viridibacillus soli]MBK3494646.1 DUF3953 domain-containing protein [Viridibacillus soli]